MVPFAERAALNCRHAPCSPLPTQSLQVTALLLFHPSILRRRRYKGVELVLFLVRCRRRLGREFAPWHSTLAKVGTSGPLRECPAPPNGRGQVRAHAPGLCGQGPAAQIVREVRVATAIHRCAGRCCALLSSSAGYATAQIAHTYTRCASPGAWQMRQGARRCPGRIAHRAGRWTRILALRCPAASWRCWAPAPTAAYAAIRTMSWLQGPGGRLPCHKAQEPGDHQALVLGTPGMPSAPRRVWPWGAAEKTCCIHPPPLPSHLMVSKADPTE